MNRIIFSLIVLTILFWFVYYCPPLLINSVKCNQKEDELKEGKEFLKTKSVVICGLIRDGMKTLPTNKSQIEHVGSLFKDYEILIVENDSIDGTRDYLLNWDKVKVLGCDGVNLRECKLNMKKTIGHTTDEWRIVKMAKLRNMYLEYIRSMKKKPDYAIVWDLDLKGNIDVDGILQTGYVLKNKGYVDAICANGLHKRGLGITYYDTYAYRNRGDRRKKVYYDGIYYMPHTCRDDSEEDLIKVESCFGGFTIYNTESMLQNTYGTEMDEYGEPICEHLYMNRNMENVYHNTQMMYLVEENE